MPTEASLSPIVDRYLRYKAGTKKVVQWLATTASFNCDLTAYIECLQLDSKAAKVVRIKTRELIHLAKVVATADPVISIPYDILVVLGDVINLRQASADWYSSKTTASRSDNDGHAFFIEALQEIQQLLLSSAGAPDMHPVTNLRNQKSKKNKKSLPNLFESLELEEPSENPLGKTGAPEVLLKEFEVEDFTDNSEDQDFALWCYLEDANETRKYVRQLWMEYRSGALSLSTVGMITECAIGMLRRAHADFVKSHPSFDTWQDLVDHLEINMCTQGSFIYVFPASGSGKISLARAETPDLLCSTAALQLSTYIKAMSDFLSSMKEEGPGIFGPSIRNASYLGPSTAIEKPLFSMLRELVRMIHPRVRGSSKIRYYETEMTEGILGAARGLIEGKQNGPPLWLVFATAICIDVAEVVDTNHESAEDALQMSAAQVKSLIDEHFRFYEHDMLKKMMKPEKRARLEKVRELATMIGESITAGRKLGDNFQFEAMSKQEKYECHFAKRWVPDLHSFPHCAAGLQWFLKIKLHDVAVVDANEQWVVLCLAHFHRAARHYGVVGSSWPDIDLVIAQHSGPKPFFTKTNSHADAFTMLRHFLLDLGVEPSALAKSAVPKPPSQKVDLARVKRLGPSTNGFRGAISKQHNADKKLGIQRANLFEAVLTSLTQQASKGSSRQQVPRKFTPAQLLATLKDDLVSEEVRLNFDYTTFATFCLDTSARVFAEATRGMPEHLYKDYGSCHGMTYFLMREAANAQNQSSPIQHTVFAKGAKVLERILLTGDNAKKFSVAAFNQCSGRIPKTSRAQFPLRPDLEPGIDQLRESFPTVTVSSLRKTIEVFDHQGSIQKMDAMLKSSELKAILPKADWHPWTWIPES